MRWIKRALSLILFTVMMLTMMTYSVIAADKQQELTMAEYTVKKPVFTNSSGSVITELSSSAVVTTSVRVSNNTLETRPCLLIAALFDESYSMKELASDMVQIEGKDTVELSADIQMPANVEGHFMKVFVWDNIENKKPITSPVIFPGNTEEPGIDPAMQTLVVLDTDFDAFDTVPSPWSSARAEIVTLEGGKKCLKLEKTSGMSGDANIAANLLDKRLTGEVTIEFGVMTDSINSVKVLSMSDVITNSAFEFRLDNGKFMAHNASDLVEIRSFAGNTWYDIKLVIDMKTKLFDVYIDNILEANDLVLKSRVLELAQMVLKIPSNENGRLYIDGVKVTSIGHTPYPLYTTVEKDLYPLPEIKEGDIVYEAEDMTLPDGKYSTADIEGARGGSVIKLSDAILETGTATFVYTGESGYYAINLCYYEVENSPFISVEHYNSSLQPYPDIKAGKYDSVFRISQNNQEIDYWKGQYDDGAFHVRKVKEYWWVNEGDTFTIEGVSGLDPSIIDYVQFTTAIPRTLDRGYLIDDLRGWSDAASGTHQPSGWILDQSGGSIFIQGFSSLDSALGSRYQDTSDAFPVSGTRRFLKQDSGTITLRFLSYLTNAVDGISWELREGSLPAVKLVRVGGNLCYLAEDGSNTIIMENLQAAKRYHFTVLADLDTKTASVFVDGSDIKAENLPFANEVSSLDNFFVTTPSVGKADMLITAVELFKGFLINENCKFTAVNGIPPYWDLQATGGSANVQEMKSNDDGDFTSFKLVDTSGTENITLGKTFETLSDMVTMEYEVLMPFGDTAVDGMSAMLGSGNTPAVKIVSNGGNICYEKGDGSFVTLWENYKGNVWYNLKIVANKSSQKADIYVNKQNKAEDAPFHSSVTAFNNVKFSTPIAGQGTMWVDDVMLFEGTYTSEVPAPVIADVIEPFVIGVQAWDLWREGSHWGYDALAPYDNRLPLLGYPEDGNFEAAEWELKFMLENAINLYETSFYRDKVLAGNPFKRTRNSTKLFDGYLNSEHMENMNFMFIWGGSARVGNNTISARDDLMENVVPSLTERFFKHPSYYKFQNKPVFATFNSEQLVTELGGTAACAAAFDEVREYLKNVGFEGAIFIAQFGGQDPARMQALVDAGFDYMYNYNFRTDLPMTKQTDRLQNQYDAHVIDYIPGLSQGWGDEPWIREGRKYNAPLYEWRAGLTWLRDHYMKQGNFVHGENSLAKVMTMISNWNEYSEGHFISPSNLKGFGYLNVIRDVFSTEDDEPENLLPQDIGAGPYDQMYPKLW